MCVCVWGGGGGEGPGFQEFEIQHNVIVSQLSSTYNSYYKTPLHLACGCTRWSQLDRGCNQRGFFLLLYIAHCLARFFALVCQGSSPVQVDSLYISAPLSGNLCITCAICFTNHLPGTMNQLAVDRPPAQLPL